MRFSFFLLFIYLFITSHLIPQTQSGSAVTVEMFLGTENVTDPENKQITFFLDNESTVWGAYQIYPYQNYYYLTNEYDHSQFIPPSNNSPINSWEGWDFVLSQNWGGPVFGYGLYKLSTDESNAYIYLDFRDDRYGNYGIYLPPTYGHDMDVWIKYDDEENTFIISSDGSSNWTSLRRGQEISIWELKLKGDATTSKFEPYPPENLVVLKGSGQVYEHPIIQWSHSSPTDDYWTGYNIYRCSSSPNISCDEFSLIASVGKNTTSYEDQGIFFGGSSRQHYKIKAVNGSRESSFSNMVFVDNSRRMYKNLQEETYIFSYDNYSSLNINNILVRINNSGGLEEYDGDNYGAEWNQIEFDEKVIVWDQGIWVVGKIEDHTHLALSQFRSSYTPGPIVDGEPALIKNPEDSLRYRVYKISKGDDISNPDYAEWPGDLGAPVDSEGNPVVYGDQTLWTVFNSLDENNEYRQWWNETHDTLPPMPIEVQELVYAREGNYPDSIDIFSNVVFFEYTIINKGEKQIDSAFISLWSDIDFGILSKNYPSIDTSLQTAYLWSDYEEEGTSPAVGYTMLYGPKISSMNDSAIFKGRKTSGFRNEKLSSFFPIPDADLIEPISTLKQAENISKGLDPFGREYQNPANGEITKFPYNGDPVENEGWVYDKNNTGTGAGFNIFTGPFTLAPRDTQWVMFALVPGLGKTNLESITNMRKKVRALRSMEYDSLAFGSSPIVVDVKKNSNNNIKDYRLSQNFPNPFNPSTTIKYSVPNKGLVQLKVFDILGNEIETLINEEKPAGSYEVKFNTVNLSSGIYFYRITSGNFSETKKMVLLR